MNILFIHQNFPGQFRHLAGYLADNPHNRVVAICQPQAPRHPKVPNTVVYKPARKPAPGTHHYLRTLEDGVLNGQAVAKVLLKLKQEGFVPDIIIAHPGWGEALYVKDVFPHTPLLSHFEFYYHAEGADSNFDPEYPLSLDGRTRIRTRNALHLLNLEACDAGVSPTNWQKHQHPAEFHSKISVIHEGIDTNLVAPSPAQTFTLPNGKVLTRKDEVITYVSRNLEPYRGFHIFMRAVQEICQRRPNAQIVIVGGDDVSYGTRVPNGQTWREKMLQEVSIDANRVHFLGKIPYQHYLALLQVSFAHVYLTVSALYWATIQGKYDAAVVLIEYGADVNGREPNYGVMPLHEAVWWPKDDAAFAQNKKKIAEFLIDHGADVNAKGMFHGDARSLVILLCRSVAQMARSPAPKETTSSKAVALQ